MCTRTSVPKGAMGVVLKENNPSSDLCAKRRGFTKAEQRATEDEVTEVMKAALLISSAACVVIICQFARVGTFVEAVCQGPVGLGRHERHAVGKISGGSGREGDDGFVDASD
jgi:hypothetical protein